MARNKLVLSLGVMAILCSAVLIRQSWQWLNDRPPFEPRDPAARVQMRITNAHDFGKDAKDLEIEGLRPVQTNVSGTHILGRLVISPIKEACGDEAFQLYLVILDEKSRRYVNPLMGLQREGWRIGLDPMPADWLPTFPTTAPGTDAPAQFALPIDECRGGTISFTGFLDGHEVTQGNELTAVLLLNGEGSRRGWAHRVAFG